MLLLGIIHAEEEYSWSWSSEPQVTTKEWNSARVNVVPSENAWTTSWNSGSAGSSAPTWTAGTSPVVSTRMGSVSGGVVGGGSVVNYQCPAGFTLQGSQCYNQLCNTATVAPPTIIVPQPQPLLTSTASMQHCIVTPTPIVPEPPNLTHLGHITMCPTGTLNV